MKNQAGKQNILIEFQRLRRNIKTFLALINFHQGFSLFKIIKQGQIIIIKIFLSLVIKNSRKDPK